MAGDMFLKLDKIKGESVDGNGSHKDEIDVLSWSWGMSQTGSTHVSSGGGSGKVSVQDITIHKAVDKATPNLMKWCTSGAHITEAQLVVRKAGGTKPLEYVTIKMKEVIVSSVEISGMEEGSNDKLLETVTLNFAYFEFDYVPQKKDGSGEGAVKMAWNIAKNTDKP